MLSFLAVFRRPRFVTAAVFMAVSLSACSTNGDVTGVPSNPATESYASSLGVNIGTAQKKSDNLYVQDSIVGMGPEAVSGKSVTLQYAGYLANGARFEASTFGPFVLGAGNVIPGWDQGIVGMKVGGRRKLIIGSTLGYGTTGSGIIPPNATLVFDVTLVSMQ
jgi:FKBP-type peptidyl-prolyl cis-trans isomerase